MIVVTGAAGFIGSCLIRELYHRHFAELVAVDDFTREDKGRNHEGLSGVTFVDRSVFPEWLESNGHRVQLVFHLGARTNTAEFDRDLLSRLNYSYSQQVWSACVAHAIPLVYASSAATYGMGEHGFSDNTLPELLRPLNPYGDSKNEFDRWVLQQTQAPPYWAGFKFFNVFGPNEYHKGRMASVVFHAYHQVKKEGLVRLFKSHHPDYSDGGQMRDFVYIKDVVSVLLFAMESRKVSGIFNLGSGQANTFYALAEGVFRGLNRPVNVVFVPTPEDIRDKYQYYTCADLHKLRASGYQQDFYDFGHAVSEYVERYLDKDAYFDGVR
jgi:ADP-L-glycero-D-manno-heptose 6-epimerase